MASSKAYQVLPIFSTSSAPGMYAVNFDPSSVDIKPLRRIPKGSIILQYESLNPTTCVRTAACAAFQKCSDGNICTAPVVQQLQAGGSGVNTTTHGIGAGIAAAPAAWTAVGSITSKLVDWWIANPGGETITHQVESRINGTAIEVRVNSATTVHLHTIVIN